MDDSKLGDSIEMFGRQGPRAMAALGLASGWADHYAAAAMYLRLNGILPPSGAAEEIVLRAKAHIVMVRERRG